MAASASSTAALPLLTTRSSLPSLSASSPISLRSSSIISPSSLSLSLSSRARSVSVSSSFANLLVTAAAAADKKRVLIVNTNSGGHVVIGFYFAQQLLASGHHATVFTVGDEASDKMKKLPFTRFSELLSAGGQTVWGDPADVGKVVGGAEFDVVLDNNGKDLDTVKPVADWAKSAGVKQFLYISSAGIYKPSDEVPHVEGQLGMKNFRGQEATQGGRDPPANLDHYKPPYESSICCKYQLLHIEKCLCLVHLYTEITASLHLQK